MVDIYNQGSTSKTSSFKIYKPIRYVCKWKKKMLTFFGKCLDF